MKPFTVLTGRIRTRASGNYPPVVCVRATTDRQLAMSQRLWTMQFRRIGLMDETSEGTDSRLPFPVTGDDDVAKDCWTAISINAYQYGSQASVSSGHASLSHATSSRPTFPHGATEPRLGQARREHTIEGGICGTVTLLVPKADGETTGRITRLAIHHADQRLASSPLAYRRVFLEMTSYLHQTARDCQLTHLEAIVHPRHAKLYRRVFNATPIGEPFACDDVAGAPAQLMKADIAHPREFHPRLRARYAG